MKNALDPQDHARRQSWRTAAYDAHQIQQAEFLKVLADSTLKVSSTGRKHVHTPKHLRHV